MRRHDLDPDRWARLAPLLDQALDLSPNRRAGFLERACGDDEDCRSLLLSLLSSAEREDGPLDQFPAKAAAVLLADLGPATAARGADDGGTIGGWRLLEEISRRDEVAVYLTKRTDGSSAQRAALTLIQCGRASGEFLSRFHRLRRMIANIGHPNIARLVDAGVTAEGCGWVVTEHVQGVPITAWCDSLALGVDERLRLFEALAGEVEEIQRALIAHGEISPANVVVGEGGDVWLLGLGIGELLAGEGLAPQQIRGSPPTTATDVHGLGLLLRELLAGTRGSRLQRRIRGDLDAIVAKATSRRPAERYATVSALREELRRYRERFPISVRPPRLTYRLACFVSRHPVAVSTAGLAVTLFAGYASILWMTTTRARDEVARLEEVLRRSERIASFLRSYMAPPGPEWPLVPTGALAAPGGEPTIRQALDRAASAVNRELGDDPALAAQAHTIIGEGYLLLGASEAAESHLRAAVSILQRAGLADDLSEPLSLLSMALRQLGRYEEAEGARDRSDPGEKRRSEESMPAAPR